MNNQGKHILIWVSIFIGVILLFQALQGDSFSGNRNNLAFSEFLSKVDSSEVSSAKIQGRYIEGALRDGSNYITYTTDYPDLIPKLQDSGAYIEVKPLETKMNSALSIFVYWFPTLLIIGVWLFVMKQLQGGGKAMGFGKSKAKLLTGDTKGQKVTFKDVAGINEAKEELTEIVEFLRDPGKFQRLGGRIPKGCLLVGPPGTGKTLLARAIAGEANVPFFSISGSDFVEMFVGIGASRVRDMFEQGKRNAPCIIFIDEIDAVGRHRGKGWGGGGHDEREQTLNQMLVEMDGFEANEGVVIIAATNRPDVIDKALLRPGRFDRQITVSNPDINGREEILRVHSRKIKHAADFDVRVIARGTPGFSGADLANLVNEAALLAARKNKKEVELSDLEDAKDKVLMGVEHHSRVMSEEEKRLTAYHEAGHAMVGIFCGDASHPIHKATIIPRGKSLGMVQRLPETDQYSETRGQMEAHIAVAMGGRVAEEIIFGSDKVTSGASMDIKSATYVAEAMVKSWGLSPVVGPVYHGGNQQEEYAMMGGGNAQSEHTAQLIDKEIKRFIDEGYIRAKQILTNNIDKLHIVAAALLEYETLTGEQIKNLLNDKPLNYKIEDDKVKDSSDLPNNEPKSTVVTPEKENNPLPGPAITSGLMSTINKE